MTRDELEEIIVSEALEQYGYITEREKSPIVAWWQDLAARIALAIVEKEPMLFAEDKAE